MEITEAVENIIKEMDKLGPSQKQEAWDKICEVICRYCGCDKRKFPDKKCYCMWDD